MPKEEDLEKRAAEEVAFLLEESKKAFAEKNAERGQAALLEALELERTVWERCDLCYEHFLQYAHILQQYLDRDLLHRMTVFFAYSVMDYASGIVGMEAENEKSIYDLCRAISGILRLYLAFVYLKKIEYIPVEYIEIVVNLKNIYAYVLKIRKGTQEEKERAGEWLTYDEMIQKIPDNTVYVDYTQFPLTLHEERLLGDLAFSCFSVIKTGGHVRLKKHEAISLLQVRLAYLFLNGVTRSDRLKVVAEMNRDRGWNREMYKLLLEDVLADIEDSVKRLYLTPDVELNSMPFAILVNEKNQYMMEKYEIAYIDSFRNFKGEYACGEIQKEEAVIIGNPRYTLDGTNITDEKELLMPLPLSRVEAEIVSEKLNTVPITQDAANKYAVRKYCGQILHIATHGKLVREEGEDEDDDGNFPLDKCRMYFAGANDFLCGGSGSGSAGNGILTAEELLHYDLSALRLCVLSICFSGNGKIDYSQGMLGFRTIFMSGGTRVLVSSLWEVDDFASAVFFAEFYENIFTMNPAKALRKSQNFLKNVTLKELKAAGWFEKQRIKKLGLVASHMEEIAQMPDDTPLFRREKYWAGFIMVIQ